MKYLVERGKKDVMVTQELKGGQKKIFAIWEHRGNYEKELNDIFGNEKVLVFSKLEEAKEVIYVAMRKGYMRHKFGSKMRGLMEELIVVRNSLNKIFEMEHNEEHLINDDSIVFYYPFESSLDEVIGDLNAYIDVVEEVAVENEAKRNNNPLKIDTERFTVFFKGTKKWVN